MQEADGEVENFLAQLGLSSYSKKIVDEGFDNMHRLKLMQPVHMEQIGLKLGHRCQLQKALEQLKIGGAVHATPQPDLHVNTPLPLFPFPGMGMPYGLPYAPWLGCSFPLGWPSLQYPTLEVVGAAEPSWDQSVFPESQIALTVGLVRLLLLQERDAYALQQLKPFGRHGPIGQLCVDALEAASGEMQNKNLRAAQGFASSALQSLVNARMMGAVMFPSEFDVIQAAFEIADHRYKEAVGDADSEVACALRASYNEFKNCDRSLGCHLFSAMVQLKKTPKPCLQVLKHTLKTLILLTCIDHAGDYFSRDEMDSIFCEYSPRDQRIPEEMELDLRSDLWHCFYKVFADLPGACRARKFKAKPKQQKWTMPSQEQHTQGKQPDTDEDQPEAEPQKQEDKEVDPVLRTRSDPLPVVPRGSCDHDSQLPTLKVKNTFLEVDESAPSVQPHRVSKTEPAPQAGSIGHNEKACMQAVIDGQEDAPEERVLVISDLNFTLVWRDFHNKYQHEGGLELECGRSLHIRPGAKELVAAVIQHDLCQLTFHSCSSLRNSLNMAQLLLQEAVPGEWVANTEGRLPFLVGPGGKHVYLVYGDMASDMPKDFQEAGRHARVKYMEPVFDAFIARECFFDPSNTIMLDSTKGCNAADENLLRIPSWWDWDEDGTIFKELQEYLFKLLATVPLPKVPAYFKEHPSKFHASPNASNSELNAMASNHICAKTWDELSQKKVIVSNAGEEEEETESVQKSDIPFDV